ncbi:MAG: membrane dipeptidase, partial [Clostridia bacterium]|nr:membrane dipeptidase [Clostridia bacterium]
DFFGAKNFIKNINNYQNFSKIVEILIKMGYNVKVINKIFFGNAQKYINYILSNR